MNLSQSLLCAALLAATLAPSHAQARPGGRPAAGGTQSADDKAIALFTEGQKLYEQGNYSAALEKFRQVDELMKSPNARLYMARCQRELGRLPEAFELMSDAVEASNDKAKTDESYLRTAMQLLPSARPLWPRSVDWSWPRQMPLPGWWSK